MQGAEKIFQQVICLICKQEVFLSNATFGMKSGLLEVPLKRAGILKVFMGYCEL